MLETNELLIGSDPEFATYYTKDNKQFVEPPAYFRKYLGVDYVPDKKHPVFIKEGNITIMEDGCAFEYTLPAFSEPDDLFSSIQHANQLLGTWLSNYNYKLITQPVLDYEVEKWVNEDDEFRNCLIFGCDEDYDAIDDSYVCRIIDALLHPYRYFGGHIHVGSLNTDIVQYLHDNWKPYISLLACFIGTTGIAHSPYPKLEVIRSEMYGKPGRYRLPNWGIEYRTLSNSWTTELHIVEKIFERAKLAFEILQYPEKAIIILDRYLWDSCKAISTCDSELALQILDGIYKEL